MLLPIKPICDPKKMRRDGTSIIYIQYCYSSANRTLLNTEIAIPPQYWISHKQIISEELPQQYGCANGRDTGQVIVSTVGKIQQPASKKFRTVDSLPLPTEEFKELLLSADTVAEPSCSLAEALTKQDLFINSALADLGASLLWSMFRTGMMLNRGFFLNLGDFRTQPLRV